MENLGTHLILDAWECPRNLLDDPEHIRRTLIEAVRCGGATLIHLHVHQFSPHGVTGTATLAESHVAIHTWPEYDYFAADLFFCGAGHPHRAVETLTEAMKAKKVRIREIKRGVEEPVGALEYAHEET